MARPTDICRHDKIEAACDVCCCTPELLNRMCEKVTGKWIAVDFDGTLASFKCDWPNDPNAVGEPVPAMVERVKQWIADGEDVRIFTARADCTHPKRGVIPWVEMALPIQQWCLKHLGKVLPITNTKDYWCKALYDDRAIQAETDTGRLIHD